MNTEQAGQKEENKQKIKKSEIEMLEDGTLWNLSVREILNLIHSTPKRYN